MTDGVVWTYDQQAYRYSTTVGAYKGQVWQSLEGSWTGLVRASRELRTYGGFTTRQDAQRWAETAIAAWAAEAGAER